ncbi:MAG: T9SS type A sorting domain-containing protein, partial [Bacteroidales bacterium]
VGGLADGNDGFVYGLFRKGGDYDAGFIYRINAIDHSYSIIKSLNRPFMEYLGNMISIGNKLYYQYVYPDSKIISLDLISLEEDTVYNDRVIMECSLSKGTHNNLLGGVDGQKLIEYNPETSVYQFISSLPSMSGYSIGAPFQCANGDIYTMCTFSGMSEIGVIAKYDAAAHQSGISYDFAQNWEERYPKHSFVETAEHELMGIGKNNNGSFLYTYGDVHAYRILQNFDDPEFGTRNSNGELTASNNGNIYGTTVNDGLYGNGCVFSVDKQTMEVKKVIDLKGVNGAFPAYGGLLLMFDTVYSHVDEVKTGMEIELVPNPATDKITVISHGIEYQPDKIEIYSLDGKVLLELKSLEGFKTEIDLKSFRNGIYVLKAFNKDEIISRKFIKMN